MCDPPSRPLGTGVPSARELSADEPGHRRCRDLTLDRGEREGGVREDGTKVRLTSLRYQAGDKAKEKRYGKTQGTLTCGGSETSPEGKFTFFATLMEG